MKDLSGKVALITGGGGGIGGGMAEAFAEKGMKLVLTDIDLDYARAKAGPFGGDAIALAHDVTSLESWAAVREAVLKRFGRVDVLCNNAGIATARVPLDDISPESFAQVMAINVTGVYNGIVTFAGEMRARRSGHIVNTSSVNGLLPYGTFAAYSASKFAVVGLSDSVRQELAPFDVGVSILFPGLTRSRMSESEIVGARAERNASAAAIEANMMEPIWLGRAVAKAIEDNSAYIISHPNVRPIVEERFANILAAFGEPAQPGYLASSLFTSTKE